jgi:DNA polymerase (family X)
MKAPLNKTIAARLDEVATLLEQQDANRFRIGSYRKAAATLRGLSEPVADILDQEGTAGLEKLPSIGEGLSRSINTLAETGNLPLLDRLRGESKPQKVLITLPGIGRKLAERLHEELGINSMEGLEAAIHDGRLKELGGFGEKRIAGIRDVLAHRLRRRSTASDSVHQAPIGDLLEVDQEYRKKAKAGKLPKIAPRRFNPEHEACLPVLHSRRGKREYTALFSNTKRAHELEMTQDWVVIYSEEGNHEQSSTLVTEPRGKLKGRRIVRGREEESAAYYKSKE